MSVFKKSMWVIEDSGRRGIGRQLFSFKQKGKEFLVFLIKKRLYEFTPIDVSRMIGVTNKTVINRCANLVNSGFLISVIVKTRIRSYWVSNFSRANEKRILRDLRRAKTLFSENLILKPLLQFTIMGRKITIFSLSLQIHTEQWEKMTDNGSGLWRRE